MALPAVAGAVSRPPGADRACRGGPSESGLDGHDAAELVQCRGLSCCVPPTITDVLPGVTVMLVSVWLTVTVTLLVTERLLVSVMVAVNLYVPAARNVTVVRWAALLPLTLKIGAAAPIGERRYRRCT